MKFLALNTLFTAITRSKAWVRVCGIGENMNSLKNEYLNLVENDFTLSFTYPSAETIQQLNIIHRDLPESEKKILEKDAETLDKLPEIIKRLETGESMIEDYPESTRQLLLNLVQKDD